MKSQLILSIFLIAFISKASFSQKISAFSFSCPVHEFVIDSIGSEFPSEIYDPTVGIIFLTANDSTFSVFDGIITNISNEKNNYRITIINKKKEKVIYNSIGSSTFKIGDRIKKEQFLGKIFKNKSQTQYSLNIIVFKRGEYVTRDKAVSFFGSCGK